MAGISGDDEFFVFGAAALARFVRKRSIGAVEVFDYRNPV